MRKHGRYPVIAILSGFCISVLLCFSCSKKPEPSKSPVIARVGTQEITLNDLKSRAELTIRPSKVKNAEAVLNNLIAEKLLVLEAGDTCQLLNNPVFQAYIQGIREQAMREMLYRDVAVSQVKLDSADIGHAFQMSERVYDVEFLTINNRDIGKETENRIISGKMTQAQVFDYLKTMGESGIQTVKWRDPEHDNIHKALFSQPLNVNDMIGPVRIGDDQWIMMRVQKVQIQPVFGPEDVQLRLQEVRSKLTELQAKTIWQDYKTNLMRGREMKFNAEILNKIVEWFQEEQIKEQDLPAPDQDELPDQNPKPPPLKLNDMLNEQFFTLDGQIWSVGDFKRLIMSHPLVYRQQHVQPVQFRDAFRQAVADLMVDHFLNEQAYQRHLDSDPAVVKRGQLWQDALLAKYYLPGYLKKIHVGELQKKDPSYLGMRAVDEYLDQLKEKYAKRIWVDTHVLKDVKLTQVPLFAIQPGMPYPVAVPEFPHYTSSDTLIFR
ncbi:hypothetical protein JW948_04640 [bacterium]|nr:hypothetical protein [bacterium]